MTVYMYRVNHRVYKGNAVENEKPSVPHHVFCVHESTERVKGSETVRV